MGVHAIDGMIDLCGPITKAYCQSFRQAVEIDSDDTTSILFRMKGGTTSSTLAVQMTRVRPTSINTEPSAWLMNPGVIRTDRS